VTDIVAGESGFEPLSQLPASPESGDPSVRDADVSVDDRGADAPVRARLATADDLESWDAATVASPNGHVLQSRAWAEFRAAHGWHTWHIAFDDGFRMLVLGRPRAGAAAAAYASRGPVPEHDSARSAGRAAAAAELLAEEGVPGLVVDGETPAAWGLARHLAAAGFEPTDEEQPSRHRMDVRLGPDDTPNSDEKTIFDSFGAQTRNLVRQAERHGLKVRRLDAGGGRLEGDEAASELEEFEHVGLEDPASVEQLLRGIHGMVDASVQPRTSPLASADPFVEWSRLAIAHGHALYLQAEHPQDGPVAAIGFARHGHRLSFSFVGARPELRRTYPGAIRLLVWRGIQIALDERRTVVDLGGVDTAELRRRPDKGDPTYGAYQFRESFGARWVEMTGAHRSRRQADRGGVGRAAATALRRLGRLASRR
jgi:hypothetical protein